ncbi:MAG: hypothetical protein DDT37_01156 [Firmicutes bacterium]|nr:hypothetical protein [candidate division NPL-UPA2 bacterium]
MRAFGRVLATMLIVSLGLFLMPSTGNIPTVGKRGAVPYGTAPQLAGDARELISLASAKEEELVYLLSLQDENGIIAQTPGHMISIPYFSNLAAMAMLGDPRGHAPVLSYMNWYVTHLNRPDKYNVTGTMYDWK